MYFDRPALKAEARRAMRTTRPRPMLVTLLYLLLTAGLSTLISIIVANPMLRIAELTQQGLSPAQAIPIVLAGISPIGLFVHILVAAFGLVMAFGYSRWALNAARGENARISDLVSGFPMAGRVLWLNVLILVYGLVLELVFAMAARLAMLLFIWVPFLNVLALWVLSFTAAVVPQLLMLRYAMSTYCMLDDPELSAFQSMRRSRQLMVGRVAEFFFLNLSFIGWYLLIALILTAAITLLVTAPIGGVIALVIALTALPLALWLGAYVTITECKFYDRLCAARPTQSSQPPFDL